MASRLNNCLHASYAAVGVLPYWQNMPPPAHLYDALAKCITQSGTNFAFTIFKGMDTSIVAYNHHGAWNLGNNSQIGAPTSSSLPGGNTTLSVANIVAYSIGNTPTTGTNLNTITFNAEAGQIYTIALGGYRNGAWGLTQDGYKLNVSAVPVPAAVWLFGSAMAGMIGVGRRKNKTGS